jgi:hypothetical protein
MGHLTMNCVVGHPRSGTALMAQILNAGGDQNCRHEYLAALSSLCVPVPTKYYAGQVGTDAVQRLLEHYDDPPTPWVAIDSNWKLTWILGPFLEKFPKARILHLTRDPRKNVASCHNLDFYGDLHQRPEFRARAFWMRWMPAVRRDDWDTLSPFERNCAFWTETHRLALQVQGHPHYRRVRFEDLHEMDVLRGLFDFFGLPRPDGLRLFRAARTRVNVKRPIKRLIMAHRNDILPPYDRWAPPARERLGALCGDVAATLGYPL